MSDDFWLGLDVGIVIGMIGTLVNRVILSHLRRNNPDQHEQPEQPRAQEEE